MRLHGCAVDRRNDGVALQTLSGGQGLTWLAWLRMMCCLYIRSTCRACWLQCTMCCFTSAAHGVLCTSTKHLQYMLALLGGTAVRVVISAGMWHACSRRFGLCTRCTWASNRGLACYLQSDASRMVYVGVHMIRVACVDRRHPILRQLCCEQDRLAGQAAGRLTTKA